MSTATKHCQQLLHRCFMNVSPGECSVPFSILWMLCRNERLDTWTYCNTCYRLNCLPPPATTSVKMLKPQPSPWLYLEARPLRRWLRLNEVLGKGDRDTGPWWGAQWGARAQRKGRVRALWEGGHLQARKRGLTRKQHWWHLDLGFAASRPVRLSISVLFATQPESTTALVNCSVNQGRIDNWHIRMQAHIWYGSGWGLSFRVEEKC